MNGNTSTNAAIMTNTKKKKVIYQQKDNLQNNQKEEKQLLLRNETKQNHQPDEYTMNTPLTERDVNRQDSLVNISMKSKVPLMRHNNNNNNNRVQMPSSLSLHQKINKQCNKNNNKENKEHEGNISHAINPFESLCAMTVVSLGDSIDSEEENSNDHYYYYHQNGNNSLRNTWNEENNNNNNNRNNNIKKVGIIEKCFPSKIKSPPSLSPKHTPGIQDMRAASHYHHQQKENKKQLEEKEILPEDELSVFRGLIGLDERNNNNYYNNNTEYIEESVMVCPFRLMGSCVKGQHTQRELISNYTIHSHLMSLAGLVHELRTEQRIIQKENQQLHSKMDLQRELIEQLEQYIISKNENIGNSTLLSDSVIKKGTNISGKNNEIKSQDNPFTATTNASKSILKTVSGQLSTKLQETNINENNNNNNNNTEQQPLETSTFANRMRRRTSFVTNDIILLNDSNRKSSLLSLTKTKTTKTEIGESKVRRRIPLKHLAEEVQTPTDVSRVVCEDNSQINISHTNSHSHFSKSESNNEKKEEVNEGKLKVKSERKEKLTSPNRAQRSRNDTRNNNNNINNNNNNNTYALLDNSAEYIVSPISSAGGSHDGDISSNDELIFDVAVNVHPQQNKENNKLLLFPKLTNRRVGSSRVLPLRPNNKIYQQETNIDISIHGPLRRQFNSVGGNITEVKPLSIQRATLFKQQKQEEQKEENYLGETLNEEKKQNKKKKEEGKKIKIQIDNNEIVLKEKLKEEVKVEGVIVEGFSRPTPPSSRRQQSVGVKGK